MNPTHQKKQIQATPLRRGWTTGACASAATKAALSALLGHGFPDPVVITLPGGQNPGFALAHEKLGEGFAEATIIKDAGDDPDVTHGALISVCVKKGKAGTGIAFIAGAGVGTITKPGLPIGVGQPAINPVPRKMMREIVEALCAENGCAADFEIVISVADGENIAKKTWNPRLGIVGGISILGTTGIVIPYSCSAWIHAIHSGIEVARAAGLQHVVGCTGDLSEKAARRHFNLAEEAYIDMGDFAGGMLKFLRTHPVARVSIAGGFAKLTKLAQGAMDLHSGRSQVDFSYLASLMEQLGAREKIIHQTLSANTASEVLEIAQSEGLDLANLIAKNAAKSAKSLIKSSKHSNPEVLDIIVVDRMGNIAGTAEGGA